MVDEKTIRQLLVASCHSSEDAKQFFRERLDDRELLSLLAHIARDAEDHAGDAPMQAAYWMSEYAGDLLIPYESALFEMLPIVNGYGGSVALALGKTRSSRGRDLIRKELGDGRRFDAWLFQKALDCYLGNAG